MALCSCVDFPPGAPSLLRNAEPSLGRATRGVQRMCGRLPELEGGPAEESGLGVVFRWASGSGDAGGGWAAAGPATSSLDDRSCGLGRGVSQEAHERAVHRLASHVIGGISGGGGRGGIGLGC